MKDNKIISSVLSYIEDNLNQDLTLDNIAEKLNYSKFHISRVFSKEMDCTIYKYIQCRRLTEAARALVETDKSIIDIAYDAHYNSQQSFTLAFRQLYLYSPQVYRKKGTFYPKQSQLLLGYYKVQSYSMETLLGGKLAA